MKEELSKVVELLKATKEVSKPKELLKTVDCRREPSSLTSLAAKQMLKQLAEGERTAEDLTKLPSDLKEAFVKINPTYFVPFFKADWKSGHLKLDKEKHEIFLLLDPKFYTDPGRTPLMMMGIENEVALIKKFLPLLTYKDIATTDYNDENVLHLVCRGDCHEDVFDLLKDNLKALSKQKNNIHGNTPIHIACHYGRVEIALMLVSQLGYQNPDDKNKKGLIPILLAPFNLRDALIEKDETGKFKTSLIENLSIEISEVVATQADRYTSKKSGFLSFYGKGRSEELKSKINIKRCAANHPAVFNLLIESLSRDGNVNDDSQDTYILNGINNNQAIRAALKLLKWNLNKKEDREDYRKSVIEKLEAFHDHYCKKEIGMKHN